MRTTQNAAFGRTLVLLKNFLHLPSHPLRYSAHYQGPFNAYNAKHYPLGSSSGSAVAVALGLVPVAIGADAGGSIRLPASAGGVVGLACTYGRVPDDSTVVTHGTM